MDRFVVNIGEYGNTSTASIPIAVCEAVTDGRIRPGDHLVMVGFGAGLTWGALALQWVAPERRPTPGRRRRRRLLTTLAHLRSFFRRIWRHIEGLLWGAQPRGKS
jgi:3-oxoacyl-[acyl-carrier-protein] synthase-3